MKSAKSISFELETWLEVGNYMKERNLQEVSEVVEELVKEGLKAKKEAS